RDYRDRDRDRERDYRDRDRRPWERAPQPRRASGAAPPPPHRTDAEPRTAPAGRPSVARAAVPVPDVVVGGAAPPEPHASDGATAYSVGPDSTWSGPDIDEAPGRVS